VHRPAQVPSRPARLQQQQWLLQVSGGLSADPPASTAAGLKQAGQGSDMSLMQPPTVQQPVQRLLGLLLDGCC